MRRWVVLFIGTVIGIVSFFIAPGAFKFLGFFFSIFCFAIALRATNQRFNFHILLICMIFFLLFGSSMITFDASNSLDTEMLLEYGPKVINTLVIALAFGVPLMLILGAIWAFISGEVMSAVRSLFYALVLIVVILAFAFIADTIGLDDFGMSDWILDFYEEIASYIGELPIDIYEGVDMGMGDMGMGLDLPDIPENKHFRQPEKQTSFSSENGLTDGLLNGSLSQGSSLFQGDSTSGGNSGNDIIGNIQNTFTKSSGVSFPLLSALSYQEFVYAIHDSLPLIAGLCNLISIPFFAHRRSEEAIVAFINKFQFVKRKIPRTRQIGVTRSKIDPIMIIFIVRIMISAWFIFLAYSNAYGENAQEDWRYTIFIYYVVVTITSSVLLLWVFRTYTPVSFWSLIKGTTYGLAGLFFLSRLFMSRTTFNAFSSIEMHSNGWYAFNTFVFIAPAETMCFCVMLPCFFLWLMMRGERKQTVEDKYQNIQHKIDNTELWIVAHQIMITQKQTEIKDTKERKTFYGSLEGISQLKPLNMKGKEAKESDKLKKLRKEEQDLKERHGKLKYKKTLLTKQQQTIEIPLLTVQRDKMLTQPRKALIFAVAILISAFVFSSLHWPIISSEISYAMYWLVGMGIINFCAGVWMCVIAWRYDWCSATTSHALFNTSTIIMVILSSGV